jgi:eukaryotic-like serine/threonine-protein kinase
VGLGEEAGDFAITGPGGPAVDGDEVLRAGVHLDRYVIIGRIGVGGMGVVYAAYDTKLDRKVALKALRGSGDERRRGRLLREAKVLAKLQHPNVVAAYDVVSEGGLLLLAMEFVDGQTLRSWLGAPRPWRDVLSVFTAAGRGLAAAHAAGVVHRDFKPDNVLVGGDGRPRVVDFGLAHTDDEAPASVAQPFASGGGSVVGTPAYMSPEQRRGERVDARSDQYNFCVALHEALYGELPGRPEAGGAGRPPPALGRVPVWVGRAINRGLSAEPAGRHPDVGALLAALWHDPALSRRRALAAGTAALAAFAAAGAWWARARPPVPCRGAEGLLAGAWDDGRREALRAAFLATGKPYAAAAARETVRALDGYARAWAALRTEVCEATAMRHEQSQELLELRNGCLDGRLRTFATFADELTRADTKAVQGAPLAARSLPDLASCSEVSGLRALVPPPNDEGARRRIAAARDQLASVEALRIAGKAAEARPVIVAAVAEAEAIGYRPLAAEAQLQLGGLEDFPEDAPRAAEALTRAIWHAEAGRHSEVLVRAWSKLALVQSQQSSFADARASARHAEELLEGAGHPAPLEALASATLGATYARSEEPALAERHLRHALELGQKLLGSDDLGLVPMHNNLATTYHRLGRIDLALVEERRALELHERALGQDHPRACFMLVNLAGQLYEAGQVDEGLSVGERSIASCDGAFGADSMPALTAAMNFGILTYSVGLVDRALALHTRAVEGFSRIKGPRSLDTAQALLNLSGAQSARGEHREAVAGAERALAIARELLAADNVGFRYYYAAVAEALLSAGRPREALDPASRGLAVTERALGKAHPKTAALRTLVGIAQFAAGQTGAARATIAEALGAFDAAGEAATSLDTATARLAAAYAEGGPRRAERLGQARDDFDRQGRAGQRHAARIEGWLARR